MKKVFSFIPCVELVANRRVSRTVEYRIEICT